MKFFTFLFASFQVFFLTAQIPQVNTNKKCYEKYDDKGNVIRNNSRYLEWECGKIAGVVDCNEKLSYDEEQEIVTTGAYGEPFNGTCETCYRNGKLERRITFVNGRENGADTSYYMSGCPQVVRHTIMGEPNGTWKMYYDSTANLAWEMNFSMGQKHGKSIFFKESADGKNIDTIKWENYVHGKLDGLKRTYYPQSKIKSEIHYTQGIFNGSYKTYNREGVLVQEVNYAMGKKHEQASYFYEDGKPLRVEHWDMGIKNGEFKGFYYKGNPQIIEFYKKGTPIGEHLEYYQDGTQKTKKIYDKKGKLIEEYRYDENGRETYSFGETEQTDSEDDEVPTEKKKKRKKGK